MGMAPLTEKGQPQPPALGTARVPPAPSKSWQRAPGAALQVRREKSSRTGVLNPQATDQYRHIPPHQHTGVRLSFL